MRCKEHPFESGVGVCAVCLHDRLLVLVDANTQSQKYRPSSSATSTETYQPQWRETSQAQPPPDLPLPFPNSQNFSPHRRSVGGYPVARTSTRVSEGFPKKKKNQFSIFSTFFNRFRSGRGDGGGGASGGGNGKEPENLQFPPLDYKNSPFVPPRDSEASVSDAKSSWFSNLIPGKKSWTNKSIDRDGKSSLTTSSANPTTTTELTTTGMGNYCNPRRVECKGMSPDRYGAEEEDDEVSPERRIPAPTPLRTTRRGPRMTRTRTSSGFSFCLSPLVRASPQRRCQVGVGESGLSSEQRNTVGGGPARLQNNRSRKLVDFGRFQ